MHIEDNAARASLALLLAAGTPATGTRESEMNKLGAPKTVTVAHGEKAAPLTGTSHNNLGKEMLNYVIEAQEKATQEANPDLDTARAAHRSATLKENLKGLVNDRLAFIDNNPSPAELKRMEAEREAREAAKSKSIATGDNSTETPEGRSVHLQTESDYLRQVADQKVRTAAVKNSRIRETEAS